MPEYTSQIDTGYDQAVSSLYENTKLPSTEVQAPTVKTGADYITPEMTVSGQLATLLNTNSPIMQLNEARSREEANRLGLLSSSMAVGAGQKALYDKGLEIATPDAATYAQFGLAQQQAESQIAQLGYQGDIASTVERNKAMAAATNLAQQGVINSSLSQQQQAQALELQNLIEAEAYRRLQLQEAGLTERSGMEIAGMLEKTGMTD